MVSETEAQERRVRMVPLTMHVRDGYRRRVDAETASIHDQPGIVAALRVVAGHADNRDFSKDFRLECHHAVTDILADLLDKEASWH